MNDIKSTIMKTRSWARVDLQKAAKNSKSIRQVLFKLGLRLAGGNYSQIKKYLKIYKIKTDHFTGQAWNKGRKGFGIYRIKLEDILKKDNYFQSFKLKKRLFAAGLKNKQCELCGWKKVSNDGRLPLELDHINGDSMDNRLENLRVLCPNCHSLQPTHRGMNKKKK
jgi:5-methylcytosine-specific restriction endonuclease McrA